MNNTIIGKFSKGEDQSTVLIKVDFHNDAIEKDKDITKQDVMQYLREETYYQPSHLGAEGCPGRWFIAYVEVVHICNIYDYALVEVTSHLDV